MLNIIPSIKKCGYMMGPSFDHIVNIHSRDWQRFKQSWNNLSLDQYMNDNGKYRYRRYAVFSKLKNRPIQLEMHQPHYQGLKYNPLQGGILRYFDAFEHHIINNTCFNSLLKFSTTIAYHITDNDNLHIEAHQFRIVAKPNMFARPTPEGLHQDGRTLVFMAFIDKKNVEGGVSSIYNNEKSLIKEYTFEPSLRYAFIDDRKLYHSVSPIYTLNMNHIAYRDILIITFLAHKEIDQHKLNVSSTQLINQS